MLVKTKHLGVFLVMVLIMMNFGEHFAHMGYRMSCCKITKCLSHCSSEAEDPKF